MKKVVNLHRRPDIGTVIYQLVMILLITLGSAIVFIAIGTYIASLVSGGEMAVYAKQGYENAPQYVINGLKILQLMAVIGIFIVPLFIVPKYVFKTPYKQFLSLHRKSAFVLFVLVLFTYFVLTPLLEFTIGLNQKMNLPEGMDWLEKLMRQSEESAERLTKRFLQMPTFLDFIVNVFLIAILPAVAEELFFRGLVQRSIYHWTRNIHFAIITAAIIFSAIHFQFFGFLPRMLLGLLFGYLLYWSGDIRLPIFAHFLNNFTAVLASYLSQNGIIDIEVDKVTSYPAGLYVVSALLGSFLLYSIYKTAIKRKRMQATTGDAPEPIHYTFPQRPGKWQKVFSSSNAHEAEIISGYLKNEGIEAVTINKKDSSYNLFGLVEIYVHDEDVERAKELLDKEEGS